MFSRGTHNYMWVLSIKYFYSFTCLYIIFCFLFFYPNPNLVWGKKVIKKYRGDFASMSRIEREGPSYFQIDFPPWWKFGLVSLLWSGWWMLSRLALLDQTSWFSRVWQGTFLISWLIVWTKICYTTYSSKLPCETFHWYKSP